MTDGHEIAATLIAGLRQDITERRIRSGLERLEAHAAFLEQLDPASPCAAQLIWRVAQWVDIGFRDAAFLQRLLGRAPHDLRARLPLRDYAAMRMAEAVVAMSAEDPDGAIAHFDAVLLFARDLGDHELIGIANFWKARCQRQKGDYDGALSHTVRACELALECGCERIAAVMRVLESWLFFQKGRHKDALRVLAESESALRDTDDAVVLGNIQSTYGRIYRQEGRYDRAIHHFTCAIDEYRKLDYQHPNLARTLANIAYVKRLVALDLRRRIDADLARRRQSSRSAEVPASDYRDQFASLRQEAFAHLDEAAAVYAVHPNRHGLGTVHLNRALLHLDGGDLERAEEEAARAFALAEEKDDSILLARSRIVQCMLENGKLEEGIEGDPRRHAHAALDYVRDAIEFAHGTQNRRLLARAHTWHGLTLCNEFFSDLEAAREAMNTASSFLDHGFHDTAWEDLRALKARVIKSQSIDDTLLAWSQGAIGNHTFRDISDQFAAILIPKVWEIEGRKIARVAARLSISPRKVRRALSRAGLLRPGGDRAGAAAAGET